MLNALSNHIFRIYMHADAVQGYFDYTSDTLSSIVAEYNVLFLI